MFHAHPYLSLEHLYVASLFYTLTQDLLGRLGPVDWTSGLRDAVDGSRVMPSFGRLVLFCTSFFILTSVLFCT